MVDASEHELLRESAGLVERPGRGIVRLGGSEAAEFLQGQVTNDVEALDPGAGCYAALLTHKGKMRADLRILRGPDWLLLDTERPGLDPLLRTIRTYSIGRDVRAEDLSESRAVLSLIGPEGRSALDAQPPEAEHSFVEGRHGLYVTTHLGADVICPAQEAAAVRAALGVPSVSEAAAECRRIESGRPRWGIELNEDTIPEEAGLNERAVSFTKGCYVGQETVARLHYKGKPNRHLRGLRLSAPAEPGDPVTLAEKQVGEVRSACVSPALGPIALAMVRREAAPGDSVLVGPSGAPAEVVELPFATAMTGAAAG